MVIAHRALPSAHKVGFKGLLNVNYRPTFVLWWLVLAAPQMHAQMPPQRFMVAALGAQVSMRV